MPIDISLVTQGLDSSIIYQWYSGSWDNSNYQLVQSSDNPEYILQDTDIGSRFAYSVHFIDDNYNAENSLLSTNQVGLTRPRNAPENTLAQFDQDISGSFVVGETLTAQVVVSDIDGTSSKLPQIRMITFIGMWNGQYPGKFNIVGKGETFIPTSNELGHEIFLRTCIFR